MWFQALKRTKKGLIKWYDKVSNEELIFDENFIKGSAYTQEQRKNSYIKNLPEYFMSQLGLENEFGSDLRMKLLGLTNSGSDTYLTDQITNESLNQNLELMINYFVHNSERKEIFESKLLPSINSAQAILHASKISGLKGDHPKAIRYLKVFTDATILGKAKEINGTLAGFDLDALSNAALTVTTFTALAWNLPVALNSAVMNSGQMLNVAISNDKSDNGLFGKKEMLKSIGIWVKGGEQRKLMMALGDLLMVSDMSDADVIKHPRRKITNKSIINEWVFNIGNWFTDHNVRLLVAYAQMLKDGSIHGYSIKNGEVEYNEAKDKRSQNIKDYSKAQMLDQGIIKSMDEKMPYGYDRRMQRTLRSITDDEIIGSMTEMTRIGLSRMNGWRALTQFKSYLPNKLHNYLMPHMVSPIMGTIKDDGIETKWERIEKEGLLVTLRDGMRALKNAKKDGIKGWSELSTVKKRNLTKLAMDVGSMIIMYGIFAGLTADWDKEKKGKQQILRDTRFTEVFKNAALDYMTTFVMIYNSGDMFSIPIINQAERLVQLLTGDIDQLKVLTPGSSTVKSIAEIIPEGEE